MDITDPVAAADYVDAAAVAAGLSLDPAHRPGVIANMQRIAQFAQMVMELPLDEATEPLPVYRP